MLSQVPVVDFQPCIGGTREDQGAVAREIRQACREIGFFTVVNHGVDRTLILRTAASAKAFFGLPLEEKMKVARPGPNIPRGYSSVANESVSYGSEGRLSPGDLKEVFDIGPIGVPLDDRYYTGPQAGSHFAPNIWPEPSADFRELWGQYYRAMETLAVRLMRAFELALRIEKCFFDDKIDRHISCLTAIHYPEQPQAPLPGQSRVGAHTDYTALSILRAEDAPGGLEVENADGEWTCVPIAEDSLVINVGDLMKRWTNDA